VTWNGTIRRLRKQVVVKLTGDPDLIEAVIELLEPHVEGHFSNLMPCDNERDFHAFATVFEVEKK
jgi:hypothetical protein